MTAQPDLSRADATRARLLEAAVIAFAEKGFHGTTTRDIASAAGMSPAALYVHHKSKEELLYLISKDGARRRTYGSSGRPSRPPTRPLAQLRRVIHDFAAHHARDHVGARVVNYELAALAPDHLAEIRRLRHEIEDEVRRLVARGVDAGEFHARDPRDRRGRPLLSLGIDLARWYRDGGPLDARRDRPRNTPTSHSASSPPESDMSDAHHRASAMHLHRRGNGIATACSGAIHDHPAAHRRAREGVHRGRWSAEGVADGQRS